jgi:membrane-bound lytic murein transglycosylase D
MSGPMNAIRSAAAHACNGRAALAVVLLAALSGCAVTAPGAGTMSEAPVQASSPLAAANPSAGPDHQAGAMPPVTQEAAATPQAPKLETAQATAASAAAGANPVDIRPRYADLWARIRAGFAMPPLETPLVEEKTRFYLRKPENLQRMFARGAPYLYYIVEEIEKRGLPTELALLPFVESAMNPAALSPAKASGLWQFIPSTGRTYNLSQDWWVDNRRDVVESTQAALEYLQKIYAIQGNDWFLALASYNWGEGAVARAVQKNRTRGKPADYLSLDMPAETRHYVPKLMALREIVMQADQLGFALPRVPNTPYFVTIEKTRPIDLKLAAQFAGLSVEEFVALNPAHNRPVIAASRNNEIKLPADRIDAFLEAVERHGEANRPFVTWQPHTLQPGESVESLAHKAGLSAAELRHANGLAGTGRLLPGTRILVPHENAAIDETLLEGFTAPRLYEQVNAPAAYHVVGRHETLQSIAQRYGLNAATLAAWNGLHPDPRSDARSGAKSAAKSAARSGVQPGTRLIVRPPTSQTLLTNEQGNRQVIASAPQLIALAEPALAPEPSPSAKSAAASAGNPGPSGAPKAGSGASAERAHPAAGRGTRHRVAARGHTPDQPVGSSADRTHRSAPSSGHGASRRSIKVASS